MSLGRPNGQEASFLTATGIHVRKASLLAPPVRRLAHTGAAGVRKASFLTTQEPVPGRDPSRQEPMAGKRPSGQRPARCQEGVLPDTGTTAGAGSSRMIRRVVRNQTRP